MGMRLRQRVVVRIEKIGQHAVEVEVHKAGARIEQIRLVRQHLLVRNQAMGQLDQQMILLLPPLLQAPGAELALLVTDIIQTIPGGHVFPEINVVQFEGESFDLLFLSLIHI